MVVFAFKFKFQKYFLKELRAAKFSFVNYVTYVGEQGIVKIYDTVDLIMWQQSHVATEFY